MEKTPKKRKKKSHIVSTISFKKRGIEEIGAELERVLRLRTKQQRSVSTMMIERKGLLIVAGPGPYEPEEEQEQRSGEVPPSLKALLNHIVGGGGGVMMVGGPVQGEITKEELEASNSLKEIFDILPPPNANPEKAKEEMRQAIERVVKNGNLTSEKINQILRLCSEQAEKHNCGNPTCNFKEMAQATAEGLRVHLKSNLQ